MRSYCPLAKKVRCFFLFHLLNDVYFNKRVRQIKVRRKSENLKAKVKPKSETLLTVLRKLKWLFYIKTFNLHLMVKCRSILSEVN